MKKISLSFILSLFFVCTVFLSTVSANPVQVSLNGTMLQYQNVPPTIINDRTMVPVRETADALGIETKWNEATSTMTFYKASRTATHIIGENTININGQVKEYDTPSQILEERTVMPIMMLADIINADVQWNPNSATVIITSNLSIDIIFVTANTEYVEVGEPVIITVMANLNTASIRLTGSDDKILKESNVFTTDLGSHIFTMEYTPRDATGESEIWYISPGDGKTYYHQKRHSIPITVGMPMKILSIDVANDNLSDGEETELVICANEYTSKMKLTNDYDTEIVETENYTLKNGQRYFNFNIQLKNGATTTYTAYPGNPGIYGAEGKSLLVTKNTKPILRIESIANTESIVSLGDKVSVVVTTSEPATLVRIRDRRNNYVATTGTNILQDDGTKTWVLSFVLSESNYSQFTACAFNDKGEMVAEEFDLYDKNMYYSQIYDVQLSGRNISPGTQVTATIKTNNVGTVWITNANGIEVARSTNYSSRANGAYFWDLGFIPTQSGSYTIYASSTTAKGKNASYIFSLNIKEV